MDLEDRVNELETRIAFQDDTIAKLDDAIADQQRQLLELKRLIELFSSRIGELEAGQGNDGPEPPPPHY